MSLHVERRVGLSATGEDGLDLVEGGDVVAVLWKMQGQRRWEGRKERQTWNETTRIQRQQSQP